MRPIGSASSAKPEVPVSCPKWSKKCFLLLLAATIAAIALRLPRLEQRPMHGDEAIHAFRFGKLLEEGVYTYDPNEYHGPTLNYLTLVPARLSSSGKLTEVGEFTLRIVPVFFGVLLVLLLLLMVDGLGPNAVVCAAVLTAISPAMVFYSRYYIQEMLLVCFTFAGITCGYRYTRSRSIKWALLTGIFLGLCHATKETSIIVFGSMLLALLLMLLVRRRQDDTGATKVVKPSHFVAGLVAAVVVSALFYSSFFTNPNGIFDSFRTYTTYFSRAGSNALHIHPWYYYLKMLIYSRYFAGPVWSEALIVFLAVFGFIVVMFRKASPVADFRLLKFIAFYTLIMTVIYSAIPYKTPWCVLGFLHGMILLAGVGAVTLIKLVPNVLPRLIVLCLLFEGVAHLSWQAYLSSYRFYADSRNPYVYAHPTTDVFAITERVEQIAQVHEDGHSVHIQVICPGRDYWPLPWYLRSFTRVGYWGYVDMSEPAAPVIIASRSVEPALMAKLYELPPPGQKTLYVPLFDRYMELRPQIELRGYVPNYLWERLQRQQAESIQLGRAGEK